MYRFTYPLTVFISVLIRIHHLPIDAIIVSLHPVSFFVVRGIPDAPLQALPTLSLRGAPRRGNLVQALPIESVGRDDPARRRRHSHPCHCEERSDVAI